MNYYLPLIIVIFSNLFYHNLAKNQPSNVNPFLVLTVAYCVSALCTFLMFVIFKGDFKADFPNINWVSYALGAVIVGIEAGYIIMYRNGWEISIASLISNIAVAVLLLFVGVCFYKETLSYTQLTGALLCIAGLLLISGKFNLRF